MIPAMFDWFPKKEPADAALLDSLGAPPLNYDPRTPTDRTWYVDGHAVSLGEGKRLFDRAAEQLMRYQIYPPDTLIWTGTFQRQERRIRPRDYILQRIRIIPELLDIVTVVQVSNVLLEPNRIGFTYVTCEPHLEQGEWTAVVSRDRVGQVGLMIQAVSKPTAQMLLGTRRWARRMQRRAHRAALRNFRRQLDSQDV